MASDISGCREAVSDEAEGVTTLAFFGGGAFAVVVEVGSMSMLGAIVGRGAPPLDELLRRLSILDIFLELGLAARPCETRRETRPRYLGLVSQAWSREKFETYL